MSMLYGHPVLSNDIMRQPNYRFAAASQLGTTRATRWDSMVFDKSHDNGSPCPKGEE